MNSCCCCWCLAESTRPLVLWLLALAGLGVGDVGVGDASAVAPVLPVAPSAAAADMAARELDLLAARLKDAPGETVPAAKAIGTEGMRPETGLGGAAVPVRLPALVVLWPLKGG